MKSFCSPKTSQKIMNGVFILSGVITLLILVTILGYILVKGLQVINFEFLFLSPIDAGREGGIFPMIISSIYVVFIAAIIATPLGLVQLFTCLNMHQIKKLSNSSDSDQKHWLQFHLLYLVCLVWHFLLYS